MRSKHSNARRINPAKFSSTTDQAHPKAPQAPAPPHQLPAPPPRPERTHHLHKLLVAHRHPPILVRIGALEALGQLAHRNAAANEPICPRVAHQPNPRHPLAEYAPNVIPRGPWLDESWPGLVTGGGSLDECRVQNGQASEGGENGPDVPYLRCSVLMS